MKLSFHGGARDVTGACHLVEAEGKKVLIDCGLFQGCKECEDLNFEDFGFNPKSIDALIITHAHIDHIGRIPRLVKQGFSGKIYSTPPTKDLARFLLEDALHIMEHEGSVLYESVDIENALSLWETIEYGRDLKIGDIEIKMCDAGHILGSAMIQLNVEDKRFLFTGDLGNNSSELLPPPAKVKDIDYLIIESVYGDRKHEDVQERSLLLERAVEDAASRQGVLMIPAFATERTQDILYLLNTKLYFKRIPEVPIFIDSPLAIKITNVFESYPAYYKQEIKDLFLEHPNLFKFKKLRLSSTVEESKSINDVPAPKVIIAGSGMMTGGRILHHLRRYLPDPKSILLVVGYQAVGSLGRMLVDGHKNIRLFGEDVNVAAEIRNIHGFSAHADNPQLFEFVNHMRDTLEKVFVVQGEESSALYFSQEIKDRLGVMAYTPVLHQDFEL